MPFEYGRTYSPTAEVNKLNDCSVFHLSDAMRVGRTLIILEVRGRL